MMRPHFIRRCILFFALALLALSPLFAARVFAIDHARYVAHVRCDHVAEDSLASVTLTRYVVRDNGTRVIGYRC